MVSMQRSLSSPVNLQNKAAAAAAAATTTLALPGSPTRPALESHENHVHLSCLPHAVAPSRPAEDTMPLPAGRGSGGASKRTMDALPTAAARFPNLMVPNKTTVAVATTAAITASRNGIDATGALALDAQQGQLPPSAAAASAPFPYSMSSPPAQGGVYSRSHSNSHSPSQGQGPVPVASARETADDDRLSFSASNVSRPSSPGGRAPSIAAFPFSAKPFLQNTSLYAAHARLMAEPSEGTSLNELAQLVRLAKYQKRTCLATRARLHLNLVATALLVRLVRCGDMAHRSLAECFRNDDKNGFAALFTTIHDVRKSCDELCRYAQFGPELDASRLPAASSESPDTPTGQGHARSAGLVQPGLAFSSPFLNDVSLEARDVLLSFLTALRNNPDYLATRLCCLSTSELGALTSFYQGMEPIDSVLPFYNRQHAPRSSTASRPSPFNNGHGKDATPVQKLLSFQRHDPLSALIHTCFASSAGPQGAEDRRRTNIWASACARLISEKGAAGEPVLVAVLNAWSVMRPWAGRSNMEWFLMKILEDGAFLLDRAEDQNGTRFNLSEWTSKDQIAAEEFYDRAIHGLFDVMDDEDGTGIPDGLMELGNEILQKLDAKLVDSTRTWFVYKWLFGTWLLSVVIHPETHGLMAEYHITEYGRQKILKEVALRAQRLVIEMTMPLGHVKNTKPVSLPPAIRAHVEDILDRFRDPQTSRSTARLRPARSIASFREAAEVHPYLVICPADLVTLANALFPDRRPRSAQSGSFRSGPGSVSNFSVASQPIAVATQRTNIDTYSVFSTSVSSANSDATTSVEPLLDSQQTGTSSYRSTPPPLSLSGAEQGRHNNYEDDGYRIRLAIHDMASSLGKDMVLGACHPCAERWAVLFISADGNSLSTQMTHDPDGDDDLEDDVLSSSNETEDEAEERQSGLEPGELNTDYHQLRNSILKLVEEYEIPQDLDIGTGKASAFSTHAAASAPYHLRSGELLTRETPFSPKPPPPKRSPPLQSRNPYLLRTDRSAEAEDHGQPDEAAVLRGPPGDCAEASPVSASSAEKPESSVSVLISMLSAAAAQSRAQSDFLSAYQYWKTIQQLSALSSESLRRNGFSVLLNIFSRGPRDSIRRSAAAVEEYGACLAWLKQAQEQVEGVIDATMRRHTALRDKMWYVTDVRNSAPYEFSRNIAVALKTMGTSRKWDAYQRSRRSKPRGHAPSYLYRTENEIVDLLAAPESQGGPNKLSDDQADKTQRWLQDCGIANFCQGEERIHRFSCEMASCIDKLVGESIMDAPVLWSSDLFLRDRIYLEAGSRPGRDHESATMDDASSIASHGSEGRHYKPAPRSSSLRGDLRATLGQNNPSLQSLGSGRFSFSRTSTPFSETVDVSEYISGSLLSPVPAIDTSTTFWSPFQPASPSRPSTANSGNFSASFLSHGQSHRRSSLSRPSLSSLVSNGRLGTASSADTVSQQRISNEKSQFLSDLRQTLTSLLLSDLGNLVFARGSETDFWFCGIGQECIERREAMNPRQRREAATEKAHDFQHGLAKAAGASSTGSSTRGDSSPPASAPLGQKQGTTRTSVSGSNESIATGSENTATTKRLDKSASPSNGKKARKPEFPFTDAYRHLLRMFCVHPNPYTKLNALFDLERLISASLSSKGMGKRLAATPKSGQVRQNPVHPMQGPEETNFNMPAIRTRPLEETIDNVKGRRSSTIASGPTMTASRKGSSGGPAEPRHAPTKDDVTCVLQSLFCDSEIRPKTLFRDLQFIASFVPPDILDRSDRGKSFWTAGLAALLLKSEVCTIMIEKADEIVGAYTNTRKVSTATASAPTGDNSQPFTSLSGTYSLADAARMLTITAKEGDPTSQRELAIFYLSNPELVERTILPLSKPREVFKKALMDKYGGSSTTSSGWYPSGGASTASSSGGPAAKSGIYDVRNDPALMCVAIHWMEAAEQGGDEPARRFLGQNEMMTASK